MPRHALVGTTGSRPTSMARGMVEDLRRHSALGYLSPRSGSTSSAWDDTAHLIDGRTTVPVLSVDHQT